MVERDRRGRRSIFPVRDGTKGPLQPQTPSPGGWYEKQQAEKAALAAKAEQFQKDLADGRRISAAAREQGLLLYKRRVYAQPEDFHPGAAPLHFFVGSVGADDAVLFSEHRLILPVKTPEELATAVQTVVTLYIESAGPMLHGVKGFTQFLSQLAQPQKPGKKK